MYKKTFTITIYSQTQEHTEEEQQFIVDMQNRVDSLAAHNFVNNIESKVEKINNSVE